MVRLQGHLPCPTPLPEHLTREFSSLYQQAPLWWRKPYTPQLRHTFFTTSTQLLHNFFPPKHYLITLLLLHTYTTCTPQSIHNFSTYTPYLPNSLCLLLSNQYSQLIHKWMKTIQVMMHKQLGCGGHNKL